MYRKQDKPYRIEWSLLTLLVEPVSSLQEFLTRWRHDPARPFSEAERHCKELLMPHLADARLHVLPQASFRYRRVQPMQPVDLLTARQRGIAQRFAAGETHSTIAAALGLSPATVRNPLAQC